MTCRVEVHPAALRELHKLPRPAFGEALKVIVALVTDPRPAGAKALVGEPSGTLRVRIGDYRIVYLVDDAQRLVTIYRVAHRREVYER
ncbi:type II toxin-antitoxin system RelE/ParE family toxin [Micromonospora sp. NBRC 101691]|uniref:type II toxin-antitoxin system RelE family toxin n=1 Tax=Micromonospora sp. NBRC 101691 TaxID=3032198 RepID=UPI0024A2ABAC|nr:type II toxin-antitoxin system RelE/ParE family toxin [Micromonospora sp. NBRC 101691]GLY26623.1 translation repressor RelE [Micromonospora sp. NBRC 101691]